MEKQEHQFDYQQFIADNKIQLDALPPVLAEMIEVLNDHTQKALSTCTDGHCGQIIKQLRYYADFILDALYLHFSNHIKDNVVLEKEETEMDEDEAFIALQLKKGLDYVTTHQLSSNGFSQPLDTRYIRVGRFMLMHELFTRRWHIISPENMSS